MKKTILLALATAAFLASPATAEADAGSAMVRVAARVLSYVKVTDLTSPAALDVTAEDVARGYVDVEAGSSMTLVTNSNDGYLVTARSDAGTVARVAVRIGGQMADERLRVPAVAFAKSLVKVGYRLHLRPGVAAGRYPWPVTLGLSAA